MGHGNFVLIFFWIFFLSFFVFYFFLTFFDRQRWATILVDNKNDSNQQQVSTLSPQITRVHACDPKTIVSIRILYALRESLYRTRHMKCSLKKVFLRFSHYSQENPWLESIFNEVATGGLQLYLKETPTQVFFYKYCEIYKNTYFEEPLRTVASVYNRFL